jgi:predicted regulator of Ras-like GTPase activity (Roadblock/LC7/MglB family)
MSALRLRKSLREAARRHLQALGEVAGVRSAVLFSADGFEIASHATDTALASRLAAIGSSLAALGGAISAEAGLRDFERSTIESADGTVTIMRLRGSPPMSLAVIADRKATLGRLLWATRHCCDALTQFLDE